ncbi:MAG: tetraacyldisaccharide 4'-kinase [Pseudomonadota bacterium]|nr:tetraacyldisaccharide 4'-kinase [Pseudomonadota bacterium]
MLEPPFWWRAPGLAARLLQPIALGYGAAAAWRLRHKGARAGIGVICIGNLTHGGAGKTPAALTIARLLGEMGERPFFLSRGYGGKLAGPLRVDPARHRADEVGDEPLLLARRAPTIVARDRVAGAELARAEGASVVVMDDGLQNPSLAKDWTLAVVDGHRGIGNARVFPAGPLRAPLMAQLERTNAVLVIGEPLPPDSKLAIVLHQGNRPLLHAKLEPDGNAIAALKGSRLFAFAGIGDPEKFFRTLTEAGLDVVGEERFPDHYKYSAADARRLLERCEREHMTPVTTEKDFVRLTTGDADCAQLAARARVLPVTLVFEGEEVLRRLLAEKAAGRH